jgi:hypothetical protein
MMVMDDVVVVVMRMVLLLGRRSALLLLLVPMVLLLLLHEMELMASFTVQTLPLPLFTLALPVSLTFFTVCPSFLSVPLASRFFSRWNPFFDGDNSRPRHPPVRRFQHAIGIDVYGGY